MVVRSRTGTLRFMESRHNFDKLEKYSRIVYHS
jgi:hypothetical protein